jgi:hypothetical protein
MVSEVCVHELILLGAASQVARRPLATARRVCRPRAAVVPWPFAWPAVWPSISLSIVSLFFELQRPLLTVM